VLLQSALLQLPSVREEPMGNMGKAVGRMPWKGEKPKGASGRSRVNLAGGGKGLPEG
jgi:hypothetical protein